MVNLQEEEEEEKEDTECTCPVCMEDLRVRIACNTPCSHTLCLRCLLRLPAPQTCPMCRSDLSSLVPATSSSTSSSTSLLPFDFGADTRVTFDVAPSAAADASPTSASVDLRHMLTQFFTQLPPHEPLDDLREERS